MERNEGRAEYPDRTGPDRWKDDGPERTEQDIVTDGRPDDGPNDGPDETEERTDGGWEIRKAKSELADEIMAVVMRSELSAGRIMEALQYVRNRIRNALVRQKLKDLQEPPELKHRNANNDSAYQTQETEETGENGWKGLWDHRAGNDGGPPEQEAGNDG